MLISGYEQTFNYNFCLNKPQIFCLLKGSYYALLQSLDLGVFKNMLSKTHNFSHNLHYYNTFLPSLAQTARLVPGLMCCDWLAVSVRCDWRTV